MSDAVRRSPERAFDLAGGHHWPSGILWTARSDGRRWPPPAPGMSAATATSYAEIEPGRGFAEWRLDVLSLLETTGRLDFSSISGE